ncbi:MAG: hypothetical protein JWO74_2544 [Solirubrobacterales bacterium]|nr:hypothetical protein [Solirubrobacterales bacterium]
MSSVLPDLERDLVEAAGRWLTPSDRPVVARTPRRSRRRAVRSVGLVAVVATAAVFELLGVRGAPRSLDLAARAYAQTSALPGQILYARVTGTSVVTDTTGAHERFTVTIQEWHRGRETHRLETYRSPAGWLTAALDHVISADGVMRQINKQGGYRIVRPSDNQDAADVIAQQQAGLIEDFRRRYEEGRLDPSGDVNFAGRPARRYIVTPQTGGTAIGPLPPQPTQAFYVDRETGSPLGYTSTLPLAMPRGGGPSAQGTTRFVETVRAIKRLDPTPKNLAKLHDFALPRRRDAQGCIRGPVQGARNSDTASRRDCGGTPGAVVDGG